MGANIFGASGFPPVVMQTLGQLVLGLDGDWLQVDTQRLGIVEGLLELWRHLGQQVGFSGTQLFDEGLPD